MIALTLLRELDLAGPIEAGRPPHLSAASGLVCVGPLAYVIADDELHLGVFRLDSREPGQTIRLFDGELPLKAGPRKTQKPDIEAILKLPADRASPYGTLLVLGSGSRLNRKRGALLALDSAGGIAESPRVVDLSPIFEPLRGAFAEINIEGAAVAGEEVLLLQRGNKSDRCNAVIRYARSAFVHAIGSAAGQVDVFDIHHFDLGEIGDVPLSFTDGVALPDGRLLFTAAAEDTGSAFDDGSCAGSAIGLIDGGTLLRLEPFDRPCKVEGVHARVKGDTIELLLVTDADDAMRPGQLLSATLDWPG